MNKLLYIITIFLILTASICIISAQSALHELESLQQASRMANIIQQNVSLQAEIASLEGEIAEGQEIADSFKLKPLGEFEITYYCYDSGATKSGEAVREGMIAVDTDIIPLGSLVYVEGEGFKIAADTGRLIKESRIDVYLPDYEECIERGRINKQVWLVQTESEGDYDRQD